MSAGSTPSLAFNDPACVSAGASVTCTYATPGTYALSLPTNATSVSVTALGAGGGGEGPVVGGKGAQVTGDFGSQPAGSTLTIVVGGAGGPIGDTTTTPSSGAAGYPNGGAGGEQPDAQTVGLTVVYRRYREERGRATTVLRWGEDLLQELHSRDVTGWYLLIERGTAGTYRLRIIEKQPK